MRHLKITRRKHKRRPCKRLTSTKRAKDAPMPLGMKGVYKVIARDCPCPVVAWHMARELTEAANGRSAGTK